MVNLRMIISVVSKDLRQALLGCDDFHFAHRLAEAQPRGSDKSSRTDGAGSALHADDAHEKLAARGEDEFHTGALLFHLGAEIDKAAGGIEVLEAFLDLEPVQGFTDLQGDLWREVGKIQVGVAFQPDPDDCPAPNGLDRGHARRKRKLCQEEHG